MTMSLDEAIRTRRSVRGFLPQAVPEATLREVFELAQWAPSNCNVQPWMPHVVSGASLEALREALVAAGVEDRPIEPDWPADGVYPGYPTPWMYDDPGRDVGPKSCDLWKPVIGAVQGMACGGAFYMLGETEFIISSDDATFFDPHVTYGMTAAFEPIQMLSKMPFPEVMRMSLMGVHERIGAERAREIGLVTEVVARDDLMERTLAVAQIIADSPPLVVQGTLRALWTAFDTSRSQAIDLANLFTRIGSDAAAFKAGQERFASGERPNWIVR